MEDTRTSQRLYGLEERAKAVRAKPFSNAKTHDRRFDQRAHPGHIRGTFAAHSRHIRGTQSRAPNTMQMLP